VLVEAHLRALVHARHRPALLVERGLELGCELRRAGERRDVVDPLAFGERAERVRVVRLPERMRVGRDREAADLDPVAHEPRHEHEHGAGEDDADKRQRTLPLMPREERGQREWQRAEPRVAEDREPGDDPDRRGEPDCSCAGGSQHEQKERCGEQLVEDLAVDVDVVPDQVRVQRRDECGDDRGALGEIAAADRKHDERGACRNGDLREADDHPVPVEPVERDQKPAVERLRVRRRDPRHEPVGAARDEGPSEVIALLRERLEDGASLVEQRQQPRQDRG
jgi:hypothetical protein